MRFLLGLVLILLLAAGGAYVVAGRMAGPPIQIVKPEKFVGVSSPLEIVVEAPGARLEALDIVLEQNGKQFPLFSLADRRAPRSSRTGRTSCASAARSASRRCPTSVGPAAVIVTAARPVLYGMRKSSTARRDFKVRLERPRVSVLSTHHYINHGGVEMVVYRATPDD